MYYPRNPWIKFMGSSLVQMIGIKTLDTYSYKSSFYNRQTIIYTCSHVDAVKQQLSRSIDFPSPILKVNPEVTDFNDFKFEDFELVGYESHPFIKAPISV